jgi:aspartate racemase
MKTIGILGGMSPESTAEYYRIINEAVRERLGGSHSAEMVIYSVDFQEYADLMQAGEWEQVKELLIAGAQRLEFAGVDLLLLATNTKHKFADEIQRNIAVPLLHIADATAEEIVAQGMKTVGLLGTRFTMEEDFYRGRLKDRFGIEVLIPPEPKRALIHRVIFDELVLGKTTDQSKQDFIKIIEELAKRGAEGVILGCTEIPLLVKPGETSVPLFDTTRIHALKAVDYALEE